LSNKPISDEDYEEVQAVWLETNCQSWKDYHDSKPTCMDCVTSSNHFGTYR
jgi:hypothetical protein